MLFEKNPRNLSGRTDYRRTYTDQHYVPIWWEQKTLHLRTLASEIFIANWLNAGYFMGYLIFLIFFYWRPCSAWINSQFHLTVNTEKQSQIIDVKLTKTSKICHIISNNWCKTDKNIQNMSYNMSCHTTLHKSMPYTKLNYKTTTWIETVKYIFPFMIQWKPLLLRLGIIQNFI